VPVWPQEKCVRSFTQRIVNTTMCAGAHNGGRDACQVRLYILFAAAKCLRVKTCPLIRSASSLTNAPFSGFIDICPHYNEEADLLKNEPVRLRLANQTSLSESIAFVFAASPNVRSFFPERERPFDLAIFELKPRSIDSFARGTYVSTLTEASASRAIRAVHCCINSPMANGSTSG